MSVVGHEHVYDFVDTSGFVKCSVYVVDRDRFRKLPSRELAVGYEVSVYKISGCAGVYHSFRRSFLYGVGRFHMDRDHNALRVYLEGADY